MLSDRVSNPGPLVLESDALLTALRGPAIRDSNSCKNYRSFIIIPLLLSYPDDVSMKSFSVE